MSKNHRWKVYEEMNITEMVGSVNYKLNYKKFMQNGVGKLSWTNIKSALVYGLVFGVMAVLMYMVEIGTVFALDWKLMVDAFVFGVIGSLIKNLLTTNDGNFAGLVKTAE